MAVCISAPALAATAVVEVGPNGALTFADQETGTSRTTVSEGDTVQWLWGSGGHSTTSDRADEAWDSGVQDAPFSFSHQFSAAGTFPYHCTTHQAFGMTGVVIVRPAGATTTSTTLPPLACNDPAAIAAARTQVDAACHCASAPSHRAYVRCATTVIRQLVKAGMVPALCRDAVKRCAASSICGRPGSVACCRTRAQGVQQCSIKPSGPACQRARGGSPCVSDERSCCDACGGAACGGAACPTPSTTTTVPMPPGNPPATTSTTLLLPQCLSDFDCPFGSLCDDLPQCRGGICVTEPVAHCPDGTPALWVGTATSLIDTFSIAVSICATDGFLFGTLVCPSDLFTCFAVESPIPVTAILSVGDGITIAFNPILFGVCTTCTFDGLITGLSMVGDFTCVDPFGFAVSTGTWDLTQCP